MGGEQDRRDSVLPKRVGNDFLFLGASKRLEAARIDDAKIGGLLVRNLARLKKRRRRQYLQQAVFAERNTNEGAMVAIRVEDDNSSGRQESHECP
jgi:hypothetical protein